jgi:ABC-type phosphate transport system substrate-binding protein
MVSGVPTPETDIAASSKQGSSAGLYTIAGTAITDPREFFIGYDSIAIIVPETNTWLTEITPSEVVDLFVATGNNVGTPKYATWGAWGTANQRSVPSDFANKPIACIGREFSSGTYDGFNSFFLANYGCASAYNVNTGILDNNWLSNNYQGKTSNTQVLSAMEDPTNAYGVGFIGLGFIQDDLGSSHPHHVVPLKLYNADTHQYVIPSIQNVVEGAYVCKSGSVIIRPLCYFMDGLPVAGTPEAVKSIWISYIRAHPEFLEADGYIPMPRIDFTGASSGNTGATGTKTVPDKIIDYRDTMYFVQAYQSFFATTVLDPYADLNADGTINYLDTLVYVAEYIACFK